MKLIPLNTVALHVKFLIIEKSINNSREIQHKLLKSVIKFNLRTLFTSLTPIYKLRKIQLKFAVKYNSVYFTKLLIETYKFELNPRYFYIVKITSLKFLKFLNDMKLELKIKKEIFYSVARGGHLNLVKFCHINNYPCDEDICLYASLNCHLDCLIYLYDNNCPWSTETC